MTIASKAVDVALCLLLAIGFFGAARISYASITGHPCPQLAFIPICYVVLAAYGLMFCSLVTRHNRSKHYLFCVGWSVAFVIALVGSVAEVAAGGGVCPTSAGGGIRGVSNGSVPLCFASLGMLILVLILFLAGPYKRACQVHDREKRSSAASMSSSR